MPPPNRIVTVFSLGEMINLRSKDLGLKMLLQNLSWAPTIGRTDGDHIDWILYRGNIAPVNYNVVASTFEGIYPSDHFPVYAKFRWIDKS